MKRYSTPRQEWGYPPRGRTKLEDHGRDGQNKFESKNRFKPNLKVMMISLSRVALKSLILVLSENLSNI
jgi:hypothetical protein